MKRLPLLLLCAIVFSCQISLDKRLEETLNTYVSNNLEEGQQLEELRILQIDSISPLKSLAINIDKLYYEMDQKMEVLKLQVDIQKNTKELGHLYGDVSSDLSASYENEYNKEKRKSEELLAELKGLKAQVEDSVALAESGTVDSLSFLRYAVTYNAKIVNADLTYKDLELVSEVTKDFKIYVRD